VTDREHHEIQVWSPEGDLLTQFGSSAGLFRPTGIAYDQVGDQIVVSDKDNHRIVIFSCCSGQLLKTFGSRGHRDGQFLYPWGVAVSPDGTRLAVADSRNHRVQLFSMKDGAFLAKYTCPDPKKFKLQFDYPRGLSFDLTGMYV